MFYAAMNELSENSQWPSCQRAEVKRVLHCDATTSVDMDALLSEALPAVAIFSPNNYKFLLCRNQKSPLS